MPNIRLQLENERRRRVFVIAQGEALGRELKKNSSERANYLVKVNPIYIARHIQLGIFQGIHEQRISNIQP